MAEFIRCRGKAYCRENGQGCLTCGRSHHEIQTTRSLIAEATAFILEQHYDNADEFASYLAEKIAAKIRYARDETRHTDTD
jgi:hypothetical protein